jgi:hypothetical protein
MPFSADLRDSSWQPRRSRICFPLPFLTVFSQWQKTPEQQQQAAVSSSAACANYVRKSNNFFPRVVVHPSLMDTAFDKWVGVGFAHFCRFFVSCFHAVVSEMVDYIISNIS